MVSIIFSHSPVDRSLVRRIADRLAEAGLIVWLDQPTSAIGDSLGKRPCRSVDEAAFAIVGLSPSSVHLPWSQRDPAGGTTLPILLGECSLPDVCADFSDPRRFDAECERLIATIGVGAGSSAGFAVDWSDEGPLISRPGAVLSRTEASVLLSRWRESVPDYIRAEQERIGRHDPRVPEGANMLAVVYACTMTYGATPDEQELEHGSTELARKFDLFFAFMDTILAEAISPRGFVQ